MLSSNSLSAHVLRYIKPPISNDRQALLNAISALDHYEARSLEELVQRKKTLFSKLPSRHQALATNSGYLERLEKITEKIIHNSAFFHEISEYAKLHNSVTTHELRFAASIPNIRVVEILEHLVRDWSTETEVNRNALISPVLERLKSYIPLSKGDNDHHNLPEILVPGSGLARAAYEIASSGYQTTAIEFSMLMDIATKFLLKNTSRRTSGHYTIHPYIHEFSHQVNGECQLRVINIPDSSTRIPYLNNLELKYGDFTQLPSYNDGHQYDGIVTLFFLDTAENVFNYLDAIYELTKPGGIWINFGPLKWGSAPQAELTMEELKFILVDNDQWELLDEFEGENSYNGDEKSLWTAYYGLRGWVVKRKG